MTAPSRPSSPAAHAAPARLANTANPATGARPLSTPAAPTPVPTSVSASPASAPAGTPTGSTILSTSVSPAIALVDNTASFALDGNVGDQPVFTSAVGLTVLTNLAGYSVTVTPVTVGGSLPADATGSLVSSTAPTTNTDTIPVSDISVEETTGTPTPSSGTVISPTYTPLSSTGVQVYSQTGPSANTGDALSNDYEYSTPIPAVTRDTYTVQLDYVAAAPL
ncbi:MAG TPA: hypothetical protein VLW50_03475 [Streptosporangiaceae bacterium]|nr:hypothetical protein [Streptosporangiaceae bacterium]